MLDREPAALQAEEVEAEQRREERGEGAERHEGRAKPSTRPPRRQAANMPIAVPITNERANATPTRKIEYGSTSPTTSDTEAG